MSVSILTGDAIAMLRTLAADSIDCCVTSPPYWGLRDYGVEGQLGLEPTLGEHLEAMVAVFEEVKRVLKPEGTLWLNYGDCYATKPNGRSAADTKAAGNDDRTFRDKPFSTVGPIYGKVSEGTRKGRSPFPSHVGRMGNVAGNQAGGVLKPKDLCMVPNRLAIALQEAGWWVRSEIIWAKPNPMPDSSGKYRPSTSHEKIFMLSKSAKCFYDAAAVKQDTVSGATTMKAPDGWDTTKGQGSHGSIHKRGRDKGVTRKKDSDASARNPNSRPHSLSKFEAENGRVYEDRYLRNYEPAPPQVWNIPIAGYADAHFATFPPALAERCILAGCPKRGVVLDPFGGAGTTGLVADRLQRDAILIELNPAYAEMARARIASDSAGLFASTVEVTA